MASKVLYKQGTKETYLNLTSRLSNALYFCTDTKELFKGDDLYTDGVRFVSTLPLFNVAADGKLYIKGKEGFVLNESRDGWVQVIFDIEPIKADVSELKETVAVAVSDIGTIKDDVATLKVDTKGGIHFVDSIETYADLPAEPKEGDMYEVKENGAEYVWNGDRWVELGKTVELVSIDPNNAHGLTAETGKLGLNLATPESDGAMSAVDKVYLNSLPSALANKTDYALNGVNGRALIFNEADGGGAKFEHTDGTWSYVGVNDGGKDGITGQIYTVDVATKIGTRLNMTKDGFFYTSGKGTSAFTENDEIATKQDIADAALCWSDM